MSCVSCLGLREGASDSEAQIRRSGILSPASNRTASSHHYQPQEDEAAAGRLRTRTRLGGCR